MRITLTTLLVLSGLCCNAQQKSPLLFGNFKQLPFRLLKPLYNSQDKQPLVVFLHGIGERGKDNIKSTRFITPLFLDSINRLSYPTYLLIPQCPPGKTWTTSTIMRDLSSLIDSISNTENVDQSRIYITGLSMGGFGTWNMVTNHPTTFAAAIPICGGGNLKKASTIKDVPVWAFHGAQDTIVSVNQSRNMIAAIKKAGGNPKYTEYEKIGHNSWSLAYKEPELLIWLFSKSRD